MPRKRRAPQPVRRIDPAALAEFQAGIRKRYSNEEILEQLRACAERLGRSPTMREFEADPETTVHPQTVIQHFKSWNEAKRKAGLVPRRFAQPADLIRQLRELGDELGRPPTAKDLDEHRNSMPSKSLYWHMFGSLKNALREAGFDVPVGEERLERAIDQGAALARKLGRLPKFADWKQARSADPELLSEWQIYRMLEPHKGAWAAFQYLVRERLLEDGVEVSPKDGSDGRDRGEEAQAGNALLGRTHSRERRLLERAVGPEPDRLLPAALDERDEDPFGQLALAKRHAEVPLDDLERLLRRGEERLAQALSEPERTADAACDVHGVGLALVEPGGGHRPAELLERFGLGAVLVDEGEDRLAVDGHLGLVPLEAVPGEDLLVVDDDPVVNALDGAVPDGMVVGLDPRMALRVVAHVENRLIRLLRDCQAVEERARSGALLVERQVAGRDAVRIARGVRAALRDAREQGLSRERSVDATRAMEAVSGNSAHFSDFAHLDGRSPAGRPRPRFPDVPFLPSSTQNSRIS